jgi:uncharacterized BrkB/YihY/UPF0761 family membrane protein
MLNWWTEPKSDWFATWTIMTVGMFFFGGAVFASYMEKRQRRMIEEEKRSNRATAAPESHSQPAE